MAAFTIYRSSDAGAPTLSGTAGDLVNLLTTVLTGPSFNGTGNAYGTTPCAGWSRNQTGTNKAVYKLGAGTGLYLRVQDDALGTTGGAQEAAITGYDGPMTDVDTPAVGTFSFPIAAQGVGASAMFVARKSATANATTRSWIIVADSRTAYVFIATGDSIGTYLTFAFGDLYSLLPGDLYNCFLIGRVDQNTGDINQDRLGWIRNTITSTFTGFVTARGYTGVGGSVEVGSHSDFSKQAGVGDFAGIVPFPNPSDGATFLGRVWIHDPTTTPTKNLRGRFRGLWCPMHVGTSFTDGDTIIGSGELAGKTFLMISKINGASGGSLGVIAVETSNTVESN